jgi:transcriptional regulator with XRE-family HTH domain
MHSRGTLPFDGAKLRAARIAAELEQGELAGKAGDGITQRYISDLERGYHGPTMAKLRALAAALGRPVADFLTTPAGGH